MGLTAAPKGFAESEERDGDGDFTEMVDAVSDPVDGKLELVENLELMLDIHEFRRVGGLVFEFFVRPELGELWVSEAPRWAR